MTDNDVLELQKLNELLDSGYSICEGCNKVFKLPDWFDELDDQMDRVILMHLCPECLKRCGKWEIFQWRDMN